MTPKSYKARFIEPGIISYDDQGEGTVLVSKETLDRMAPTFKGCPVIFVPEKHNDSDKDTAFNFDDIGSNPPSGIVSGAPYWGDDGWQWVDMLVWDEDAQRVIEKGFSVSCAYMTDETSPGGKWHELLYDEEITGGHYMHMAIVERPRYEGSRIFANSKGGKKLSIFKKPVKANAVPPAPAVPEKKDEDDGKMMVNDDTTVDVNGTPVPLHELMAAYIEKQGGEPQAEELVDTDSVTLPDGSQVTIADLKAAYGSGGGEENEEVPEGAMPNAEPPADTSAVSPVTVKRQNSAAPVKPAVKTTVNKALKNAAARGDDAADFSDIETESQRLARGKMRYSRSVNQEGK